MASRAAGLPSNPRARARSVGRSEREYEHRATPVADYPPVPSTRLARQRSIANVRPTRDERAPPPPPPIPADHAPRSAWRRPTTPSSRTSVDSTSSTGSSTFSGRGYASSRTSLEEDAGQQSYKPPARGASLRDRRLAQNDAPKPVVATAPPSERLWDTVVGAANSLTVNISMAWASGVATASGEVTPPGSESHLTRALKAYHLQKAKDRSDLPDWLFEEHERRGKPRRTNSRDETESRMESKPVPVQAAPPRRRVFAAGAADYSSPPSAARSPEAPPATRATERLRSIRDARRGAMAPRVESPPPAPIQEKPAYQDRYAAPRAPMAMRRGLPSRPSPQHI
ncbi:hypothetical protein EV122DRAFT_294755 [Schizophyllum commune]